MDWIKSNARFIATLATILIGAFGSYLGVTLTVKADPNATKPEIHIVIPASEGSDITPIQGVQATAREKSVVNSLITNHARRLAVRELMKNGMARDEAFRRVNSIPESAVAQAVIDAGVSKDVYGAFGDGGFLKKVIDFISDPANQEKIKAIVAFLVQMAMLFASADSPGDWPAALTAWSG